MIFDGVDTDVFQYSLDHFAQEIPAADSKRRLLIVDNASWHKSQRLNWHHFEVHYLPGYSPDFNPIERLWLRLKADFFSDFIAKSPDELTQAPLLCADLLHERPRKSRLAVRFSEMIFCNRSNTIEKPGQKGVEVTLALQIVQTVAVVAALLFTGWGFFAPTREQRFQDYLSAMSGFRWPPKNDDRNARAS